MSAPVGALLADAGAAPPCFAFSGPAGEITVELAAPAVPAAFQLERAPSVDNATNAPRQFSVRGYETLADAGVALGAFSFDARGAPAQRFPSAAVAKPVAFVKLSVANNHGAAATRLCRFGVF